MSLLEPDTHTGNSLTAEMHSEPDQISKLEPFCEKCVVCEVILVRIFPNFAKFGLNRECRMPENAGKMRTIKN